MRLYLLPLNYLKNFEHYITTGVGFIPGKGKNKIKMKERKTKKQTALYPTLTWNVILWFCVKHNTDLLSRVKWMLVGLFYVVVVEKTALRQLINHCEDCNRDGEEPSSSDLRFTTHLKFVWLRGESSCTQCYDVFLARHMLYFRSGQYGLSKPSRKRKCPFEVYPNSAFCDLLPRFDSPSKI